MTCNTHFPIIKSLSLPLMSGNHASHLTERDTFTLLQRVRSSMTISLQGKAAFDRTLWPGNHLKVQFNFWPLDGPFNQEIPPPPAHPSLSPLSSSLPTKWMTAFRNTRVRHDSEVHMLGHLCPTCFDASAAREAEKDHAYNSTSSQLMLQAETVSKL